MTCSRGVALVSHGRGSGGTSIATPGTSCTWATNWEGQASVAACGSAQAPTTAKITTPAVVNLMMSGASDDGTPLKTIPPAGAAASHRQGTPSARIWINMLRRRDGALSGCLGGAQDRGPPGVGST